MKAAVWQGRGHGHAVETVPDPTPAAGQVVLKVERSAVCGSDLSLSKVRDTPALLGPEIDAAFNPGAILGHELCGTVVATGPGVDSVREGNRLAPMFFHGCGRCAHCLSGSSLHCPEVAWFMGGYAQFALARPDFAVKLPAELSIEDGALVEPLATSLRTVIVAGIQPGARVLVLGAGALGLGAAYFVRRLGAGQVIMVARTAAKADAARRMGADRLIASAGALSPEDVADAFGGLPDVVIESAGAPGLVDSAILCVRPGGTIVVAGLNLDPEMTMHAVAAMKDLTIRYTVAYTRRDFDVVVEMLTQRPTWPLEMSIQLVDLEEFPTAFEALRAGGAASKLMLDPWAAQS